MEGALLTYSKVLIFSLLGEILMGATSTTGTYQGQTVAIKVLRVFASDKEVAKIQKVCNWSTFLSPSRNVPYSLGVLH